ncbi:MAG: nucleoside phosphorylase [Chloroflexi bacterium]|nr:nucleoside phosphorylase [Chloroflexota bacterium]
MRQEYPILEFDSSRRALLEPNDLIKAAEVPQHAVACFFQDVITGLSQEHEAKVIYRLQSEIGTHPVYEIALNGKRLAVFHPGVGAPLAAALLEEMIALGCSSFIACGGAGVLDSKIALGHIIVPSTAVRDEGTSYHYLPPGREVSASERGVAAIEKTLNAHDVDYLIGKCWTTDAIYRETVAKVQLRKAEGCLAVEMEAAALFAVARFRGVELAQLLYGGDDVGSEEWDSRHWQTHTPVREKLFWLASEACLLI